MIDLTVPGPEAPLISGIADRFAERGLKVFGPSGKAAMIEGSKSFAKELMAKVGVPTPRFEVFDDPVRARRHVSAVGCPVVIKADGLAAGKGVSVCFTPGEAMKAIEDAMERRVFGAAGSRIVVEEFVRGEEATLMAVADGDFAIPLQPARDHKRAFDGDVGPNTGGMGAYSPIPSLDREAVRDICRTIVRPVLAELLRRGTRYTGVIYAGLMLTDRGPVVLEFNARFGDPETQVVLPLLKTDLAGIVIAAVEGELPRCSVEWADGASVCVVMASAGYPGPCEKGKPITGLELLGGLPRVHVFHAGTAEGPRGETVTSGGRVLGVTATGETLAEARDRAYDAVSFVRFEGAHYRRDIASDAAGRPVH
jgi:phosphoribosylamine--glycine ligase